MRFALATWTDIPTLTEDDRTLLAPLAALGVTAVPAIWNEPRERWDEYDAIVLRSTWDYFRHIDEFLEWVDRAGAGGRLWNPPAIVRWNAHKSYLHELSDRGVPVIPTRYCPDLESACATVVREGWDHAVVKGTVSAGGFRTYRVTAEEVRSGSPPWTDAPPLGEIMVQPYEEEVERSGERSLVFLDGSYSHAFLRAPRLAPGSTLVEGAPVRASDAELAVARSAIAAGPGPTLYARADVVPSPVGSPRLMELELIEPALGLRSTPGAAERLAGALVRAARDRRR